MGMSRARPERGGPSAIAVAVLALLARRAQASCCGIYASSPELGARALYRWVREPHGGEFLRLEIGREQCTSWATQLAQASSHWQSPGTYDLSLLQSATWVQGDCPGSAGGDVRPSPSLGPAQEVSLEEPDLG